MPDEDEKRSGPVVAVAIRRLADTDSTAQLTELLHRAYAPLAASGLRYLATHQTEDITRERCAAGACFVAELAGVIVGTITYYSPSATSGSPWLDRPDVALFGQLAVEPALKGRRIGGLLVRTAETQALEEGARYMALDTAVPARHLITWYERLGYRTVEYVNWPVTNYRSVVMIKPLASSGEIHKPK